MVPLVPLVEGEVIRRYSVEDKERERNSKRNEDQRIRIIAHVTCYLSSTCLMAHRAYCPCSLLKNETMIHLNPT